MWATRRNLRGETGVWPDLYHAGKQRQVRRRRRAEEWADERMLRPTKGNSTREREPLVNRRVIEDHLSQGITQTSERARGSWIRRRRHSPHWWSASARATPPRSPSCTTSTAASSARPS